MSAEIIKNTKMIQEYIRISGPITAKLYKNNKPDKLSGYGSESTALKFGEKISFN